MPVCKFTCQDHGLASSQGLLPGGAPAAVAASAAAGSPGAVPPGVIGKELSDLGHGACQGPVVCCVLLLGALMLSSFAHSSSFSITTPQHSRMIQVQATSFRAVNLKRMNHGSLATLP